MAIKDELIELNQTKQGIKTAFEEKGVDLQGKTFSDTPALIGAMNVGKGDEVESFAVGAAKTAQENDKVILNYAADMLPFELQATDDTFKEATTNPAYTYNFLYVDMHRLFMGTSIDTAYPQPVLLARQEDGTYAYKSKLDTSSDFLSRLADFIPYGLFVRSNNVYKTTADNTFVLISNNNYIPGTLTYLRDGSLACSGGSNPKLLKNVNGEWEVMASLSGFQTDAYKGYGLIGDKLLVIESSSSSLKTFTYDETGATTLVGSTTVEGNTGGTFWRFFDNNTKVIVGTSYNSSDVQRSNLKVFDVTTVDSGAYQFTVNSDYTSQLQSMVTSRVGNMYNVIFPDGEVSGHNDMFFIWGEKGMIFGFFSEYGLATLSTPFEPYTYTGAFFVNPVDRIAVMQINPTTTMFWFFDSPTAQDYIAEIATNSSFFPGKSTTGFVKENKNGVLKVSTVLDPTTVAPSFPDTDGLDVTVNPGAADSEQLVPYGTGTGLNNANGLTFFGFMLYKTITIGGIEMKGRTDGGSSSSTNKYLKLFKWNWTNNVYDFVACSTNTQQALAGTTARWEFATDQQIDEYELYGFAFSTDNTSAWSNITGSGIQTQATDSDDYHLMGSTSTSNPPSTNTFSFIPVFSFIQTGLIEGSVDISWGYATFGGKVGIWPSMYTTNTPVTLDNIEGVKATVMKLYLVYYTATGSMSPKLSASSLTDVEISENGYYTDIMGNVRVDGDEISSFGFKPDEGMYMYPVTEIQVRAYDETPFPFTTYMKVFEWNEATNSYDYIHCSYQGQQDEEIETGVNYKFASPVLFKKDSFYRCVFSSNPDDGWADLVTPHLYTVNVTTGDYRLMSSTSSDNPPSTDAIACIPDMQYTFIVDRIPHYLQDVYLSDTLDYFVDAPQAESAGV